jgi:hypothetical protein
MQWNFLSKHKQVPRSKLWNEVIKSWKHILTKLKYFDLANFFFILHCNLLWTSTFHTLKFGWSIERGANLVQVWMWKIKVVWDLDANEFVPWNAIVKIYKLKPKNLWAILNGGKLGSKMRNNFEIKKTYVQSWKVGYLMNKVKTLLSSSKHPIGLPTIHLGN